MPSAHRIECVVENPVDGTLLVLVPGGRFLAGGPRHFEGEAGLFVATLPSFYLALHPVTNAQWKRFLDATGHPPPARPRGVEPGEHTWEGRSCRPGLERHPVVAVTWAEAVEYASWAGLRLPSELEWEKGARGTDGREFPWGDEWSSGACRNDESRARSTTCEVWEHGESASPWGCYQMSGNVWEWCADAWDERSYVRYSRGDLRAPAEGAERVVRGGSWFNVGPDTFLCAYRFHLDPDGRDLQYGFRLARSAET